MGFSRQELWSGLPLPSPIETLAVAVSLQSCPTLCNPMDCSLPGFSLHGILQARTLECHFLLQCMKVKSESEVIQSCATLSNPMDCSLPGFSHYGIFQERVLESGAIAFSGTVKLWAILLNILYFTLLNKYKVPEILKKKKHDFQ